MIGFVLFSWQGQRWVKKKCAGYDGFDVQSLCLLVCLLWILLFGKGQVYLFFILDVCTRYVDAVHSRLLILSSVDSRVFSQNRYPRGFQALW